ncbi:hypothetical protein BC940DRAFT_314520 [Gongronella butleri]|nr:hypothetical protein BC940DRAFT_314520 [Gongronella butleri]
MYGEQRSLSNETLIRIFLNVDRHDRKTLRLCSRAWRNLLNPFVFDRIRLKSFGGKACVCRRCDTPKERDRCMFRHMWADPSERFVAHSLRTLGPLVRHVAIPTTSYSLRYVMMLIKRCKNVTSISIHTDFIHMVNVQLLRNEARVAAAVANMSVGEDPTGPSVLQRLVQMDPLYGLENDHDDAMDDAPSIPGSPLIVSKKLSNALRPILRGRPDVELCGALPLELFKQPLLTLLKLVQNLTLSNMASTSNTNGLSVWPQPVWRVMPPLEKLRILVTRCPEMTSLAFSSTLALPSPRNKTTVGLSSSFLTAFTLQSASMDHRHAPGAHHGCDPCSNPWPSITSLSIDIDFDPQDLSNVPALIALICVKFPQLRHLKLSTSNNIIHDRGDLFLPDHAWMKTLDLHQPYLTHLESLSLSRAFSAIALDCIYFYTKRNRINKLPSYKTLYITSGRGWTRTSFEVMRTLALAKDLDTLCLGDGQFYIDRPHTKPGQTTLGYSIPQITEHPLRRFYWSDQDDRLDLRPECRSILLDTCPKLTIFNHPLAVK